MMTEEEKSAWNIVSDEAAQELVDTVNIAAGETLLRGALRKMLTSTDAEMTFREAWIYQALMAASSAGYDCGIKVGDGVGAGAVVTAYIRLPNGVIGMLLTADWGSEYIAYGDAARETVQRFLGD